jgi:hypothetical protein
MSKKFIAALLLGVFVYACSQTLYVPTPDMSGYDHLIQGRKLYVNHCSGCHNLHFPQEFTAEQWIAQLEEMQVKAKITEGEKDLIYKYLVSHP